VDQACEFPRQNASAAEIGEILQSAATIAVVGLSDRPERDSYRVATYLKEHGYRIVPINPNVVEVLGEKSHARLSDVTEPIDVVDIFRKPEAVPDIVDDAIKIGAKAVWMQDGIVHNVAADKARAAGLKVVMNACMLREHLRRQR
jgi:predicted CoA-binding protein